MRISDYLIFSKNIIVAYNKMCEPVLKKYDISQVSFDILMFLTNNPEYITAQDISEIKGIKKNLVSVHVEKLVRVGLLKRGLVPGDRRKISLCCTEKARPIIEAGLATQNSFYKLITIGVIEEDLKAYKRIIKRVMENTTNIMKAE